MFSSKNLFFTSTGNKRKIEVRCPEVWPALNNTPIKQCAIYYGFTNFTTSDLVGGLYPPMGWTMQRGPTTETTIGNPTNGRTSSSPADEFIVLKYPTYFYSVFSIDAPPETEIPVSYNAGGQFLNILVKTYKMENPIYCGENEYGPYFVGEYGCLNLPLYCCGYDGPIRTTQCVMQNVPGGPNSHCQEPNIALPII
jgi:hypothetical protein